MTELSENRFIPGFASGIAGMSAGETKDVEARLSRPTIQSRRSSLERPRRLP
jgi:hypothetical protein